MTQADSVHSTPPLNTSAINPTAGMDWLDISADASTQDIFRAIGRLRKEARDEIDRLIRFLDETDNHMELEPNGDELDASYPESGPKPLADPHEDAEGGADDEPSLGFLERHCSAWGYGRDESGSQLVICSGKPDDLEDEHDGAEPDEDGEPSLGAFEGHDNQAVAWAGDTWSTDYELDPAESGIGDYDGLLEQIGTQDWQQGVMA